ncbi:MAG: trehalose-phosphatase [Chloroflexi bacterium]|nr:trehalose-phosphatase [Chloroflexota bacterium]
MNTQTPSAQYWKDATETVLMPLMKYPRLGLITDMDGTISYFAETPEAAVVTPRNRQLLGTIVLMLPMVAAISGRSARDLQARIAIPGMVYVGNHGLERWENGGRVLNENVRQYRKALAAALDEIRPHLTIGMWIEDKYATASIHYRLTPKPEEAAAKVEYLVKDIAAHHGLHANKGRRLFEIRPPIEANKGTALAELVQEYNLDAVIYMGDDMTDVDAMEMALQLKQRNVCHATTVGVVPREITEHSEIAEAIRAVSDVLVDDVSDVEVFLGWFLDALTKHRN